MARADVVGPTSMLRCGSSEDSYFFKFSYLNSGWLLPISFGQLLTKTNTIKKIWLVKTFFDFRERITSSIFLIKTYGNKKFAVKALSVIPIGG